MGFASTITDVSLEAVDYGVAFFADFRGMLSVVMGLVVLGILLAQVRRFM